MSTPSADAPAPIRHGLPRLTQALARPRTAAVVAGLIALAIVALAPRGEDAAAHLYQTQVWREHAWRFWDNNWYAGRYSQINYSLLYYPVAAIVGTWTVVTASVAGAAAAFAHLLRSRWPELATWPAALFTLLAPLPVLNGTYPFVFGLGLALATLAALQARRWKLATALGIAVALGHLLALFLLDTTLAALALRRRVWRTAGPERRVTAVFVAVFLATVISWRAFSTPGAQYPFNFEDLSAVMAFCLIGVALSWKQPQMEVMRAVFAIYAAVTIAAFAVASPLGSNVGRLVVYLGAPLLLLPLAARRYRPRTLTAVVLLGALTWQMFPIVQGVRAASTVRSSAEEYWYPVEAFLATHGDPNHRVEVVATDQHWEAFYLARRGVPLTRGWYRQDDFPSNAALYGDLTRDTYRRWLSALAVRYVFLPDDRLDYSAQQERDLLQSGVLPQVARMGGWTVYEVPNPTPLATPAGSIRVASIDATTITLDATEVRTYRLRLRYTPYWEVVDGSACVAPTQGADTQLRVLAPGRITLRFSVGLGTVVDEVIGRSAACEDAEFIGPIGPQPAGADRGREIPTK